MSETAADFVHAYEINGATRWVVAHVHNGQYIAWMRGGGGLYGGTPGSVASDATYTYATRSAALRRAREMYELSINPIRLSAAEWAEIEAREEAEYEAQMAAAGYGQ